MVTKIFLDTFSKLNIIPSTSFVSDNISPSIIVIGKPSLDYNTISKIDVSNYVQMYEDTTPMNNNQPCTSVSIELHPTGNEQGSYYCMYLSTGQQLNRQSWDELLIINNVIITA